MRGLFRRLDSRARVLTIVAATLIMASTPPGELLPFSAFFALSLLLILTGRTPASHLLRRCLAASPFILLAAGLLAFQGEALPNGLPSGLPAALSVACKGFAAILLLAFLTAETPLTDLLTAMRRMGSPASLNLILGMMNRYTSLFSEEFARMERARDSRTVRPLGKRRYGIYGRQLGALILRSWDRAERVHSAMLSRGFNGAWPDSAPSRFRSADFAFLSLSTAAFLSARVLL